MFSIKAAKTQVAVAVTTSFALSTFALFNAYYFNIGSYKRKKGIRDWVHALIRDFSRGEDLIVALEASLFPRGGSFAVLKASPLAPVVPVRSISFAGGGFRTLSYMGQLLYLEKRGMIVKGVTRYYGASLGAFVATGMILGETNPDAREKLMGGLLEYVCQVADDWFGMWGVCGAACRAVLEEALPEDITPLNGRLFVSITVFSPFPRNRLVSVFESKADLISTLLASSFIPLWTDGPFPFALWRGRPCLDGGIFDNIPTPGVQKAHVGDGSDPTRTKFGVLNPKSLEATLARPQLRHEDGHFTCKDGHAPLTQVLRPPPHSSVEVAVLKEVRRGYLEARAAVVGYPGI